MEELEQILKIVKRHIKEKSKDHSITLGELLNILEETEQRMIDSDSGPSIGDGPNW